jgi:hypothetical protein
MPNGTEGCSSSPENTLFIGFSSAVRPDGKALYATVLAALLVGKQMNVGVQGCGINGWFH